MYTYTHIYTDYNVIHLWMLFANYILFTFCLSRQNKQNSLQSLKRINISKIECSGMRAIKVAGKFSRLSKLCMNFGSRCLLVDSFSKYKLHLSAIKWLIFIWQSKFNTPIHGSLQQVYDHTKRLGNDVLISWNKLQKLCFNSGNMSIISVESHFDFLKPRANSFQL